jgi:integrase
MARKKERCNGSGTVYPRKNKQGKIMGYRGSYFAPDGKRRYVSARRKGDAERALRQAMRDADRGFVFDGGTLILGDYLTRYPPKRNKSRRTVKLTPQAAEALKGHRARQNEERLQLGSLWEDWGLVFPNRSGKPMNPDYLYHRGFKPLLERAELSGFTFHSLRHTCATLLLSENVNPKIVSEMLGHATISQTMDTYSHVMPGMGDVASTALEEALS